MTEQKSTAKKVAKYTAIGVGGLVIGFLLCLVLFFAAFSNLLAF